jgi:cyanate lyase
MFLNRKVKERIRETGIMQRFLGDKFGVDEGAFASMLLGRRHIPQHLVDQLCYALALDPEDVIQTEQVPA